MSVVNIVKSILQKAKKDTDEINNKWKIELEEIKKRNNEILSQRKKELNTSYEQKKSAILEKAKSMAVLEWKNQVLKAKHNLIEKVFVLWRSKIASLPKDQYQSILVKLLMKINENTWELTAWKWETAMLNEAVKFAKKWFKIVWEWDFKWWFKLVTEFADYDFSFDNLFANLKKDKELEIANRLFANV